MTSRKLLLPLFSIIIGFLSVQNSFCQENFIPGYIIQLNGDTLKGYIDYRDWDANPKKIFFKENSKNNISNYTPIDIKEFSANEEIYVSAIVKFEKSSIIQSDIDFNNEFKIVNDTVFLKTMIRGAKSLYLFKKESKEQFYIGQNSTYELLYYKMYFKNNNGYNNLIENKRYLGQLSVYLQDCPKIQKTLNRTKYNIKDIESLFEEYYDCSQTGMKFQKKSEKISTEIGVLAGMTSTSIKFTSTANQNIVNADYKPSLNFTGAIFFDIILPRNQGKWSICNEAMYSSYKIKGHFEDYYSKSDIALNYSYFKFNSALRFKYPINKAHIFFNAGFSIGSINSENTSIKTTSNFNSPSEKKAINNPKTNEMGFILGLGAKVKSYSFEFRYEGGNGMTDNSLDLLSSTSRLFFLLGYRFL